jgi:hypothetical protein
VNGADIIALHFLVFGRLEAGESHDFHYVDFILKQLVNNSYMFTYSRLN